MPAAFASRRHDLDWIRAGAFALLILYHLGMLYVQGWGWHVKSRWTTPALQAPMLLLNPWRLTLLFFVSGAVSAHALRKFGAAGFARERSYRLALPLLFAIFIVVPLQSYAELWHKVDYRGDFLTFYVERYLTFGNLAPIYGPEAAGFYLPTYNHMWFVLYVLAYALVAAAVLASAPRRLTQACARWTAGVGAWAFLIVPVAALGLARVWLGRAYPETHLLVNDWHAHLHYGLAYALGLAVAGAGRLWLELVRLRRLILVVALACFALRLILVLKLWPALSTSVWAEALAREAYAWAVICVILAYARASLDRDSAWRAPINQAIFTFYLFHQTFIIGAWWLVQRWQPGPVLEPALVTSLTLAGCWAAYALALRSGPLRPWLGLRPLPAAARTRAETA